MPRILPFLFSTLAATTVACGEEGMGTDPGPAAQIGLVEVTWSFARQDGQPASCSDVGAIETFVYVAGRASDRARAAAGDGGTPPPAFCGDEQRELFTNLQPGSYPVVIQVFDAAGAVLAEWSGTAVVEAEQTTTVDRTIGISGTGFTLGNLRLRWLIDGVDAQLQCVDLGATTVRIRTVPGSLTDLEGSASCIDDSIPFSDVRVGGYTVRAELIANDESVLAVDQQSVNVLPEQEVSATFNFNIGSIQPATVHARWTVEGQEPATACADEDVEEVEVAVQRLNTLDLLWETIETATAACDAGSLDFPNILAQGIPRAEFTIFRTILDDLVPITSTVTQPFAIEAGETSTVTVDFNVRD